MGKNLLSLLYVMLFIIYGCGDIKFKPKVKPLRVVTEEQSPVTLNITPASFNEDLQSIITLEYSDANEDLASDCSISNLSNVTVTQACSCTLGICVVGITGISDHNGNASFDFTVTANENVSNSSSATLTLNPVNDSPVISSVAAQVGEKNIATGPIPFSISDVDSSVACGDVSFISSNSALVLNTSIIIDGTAPNCTVTLTPETNQVGLTNVNLTVSDGNSSNQTIFGITFSDNAPISSNLIPAAFDEDVG